jgi:hypothetical protein
MQEVKRVSLIEGKEYYLESTERHYPTPYKMIGKFERLKTPDILFPQHIFACFNNFRKIKYKNDPNYSTRYVELNCHWKFYEISSNKIQKDMENRSYITVLKKVIKDEYFIPIDVICPYYSK